MIPQPHQSFLKSPELGFSVSKCRKVSGDLNKNHELAGCNPSYDTAITIHSIDTTLTFLSSSIDTIVQLTDPTTGEKYYDTLWVDLYDTAFSTNYDTLVTAVMDTQNTVLHQAMDYYPYGKVLRMLQFDPQRHRLQGNQHDNETGLEYFNARNLESDLAQFRSIDPVFHAGQSPYNAFDANPINMVDPLGTNSTVLITGDDAEQATQELDQSSSLNITRDSQTGKLSATGEAKTKADKKLLEAINDENVFVELETKTEAKYTSKDGTKDIPLIPGGYEGSAFIKALGYTVAVQYVNMEAVVNIAKVIGEQPGETITHEINEAYIGATDRPGGDYNSSYNYAHGEAEKLDRKKSHVEFNQVKNPNHTLIQARKQGNVTWHDIIKVPK